MVEFRTDQDGHVARMDTSLDITRALKVSIRGLPKDWRRPPGRPRHTWLRTVEADLQPLNLGLNSARKYTLRIENTGSTSWKPLRSSSGLARDDDDEDGKSLGLIEMVDSDWLHHCLFVDYCCHGV